MIPALIPLAKKAIAPVVAKLASPMVKWSLIGVLWLISLFAVWHYTSIECEREKTEAIAVQAAEFSKQQTAVMVSREDVLRQRNEDERTANQKIVDLQKRLVIYERNAKKSTVPVPPDSVGMFNAISGLLPPADPVPGANPAPGKSDESSEARIEVTRLLLAYVRAYNDCAGQLESLWRDYKALVDLLRFEYAIKTGDE